ncbi:lytic transglycosylase domain-containing protein [Alphaproteobacteria bacterium]|nr:lytic transglycosylase domain-containing protein [Alphaproteobacteria bacterium]
MHNPANIFIKHIIVITSIFILCFILHSKYLLADNVNKEINKKSILSIIELINENKWNKVEKILKAENSIELIDLANWIKISSKNNLKNEKLIDLYYKYIDWPASKNLIKKIEQDVLWENYNEKYYDFLNKNPPVTLLGKTKLAKYNQNINQEEIIIYNWINGAFNKKDELYIYLKYSNLFNNKINTKRLNNLIWKKQWSSVDRQIKRVEQKDKLLANAKIKLSRREYGVDYAVKNVPKEFINNEALVYERVKWRRNSGLTDKSYELLSIYLDSNTPLNKPNLWWNEINWHVRNLFKNHKYKEAYQLMSQHQQKKIANIANAEWLLGWIALTYLDKPEQAKKHFLLMKSIVKMPISLSRVNYWLGMTEETLMNIEESKSYYKLAGLYNSTYYGLLANIKLTKQSEFKAINLNEANKNVSKNFINKLNVLKLLSRADEQKYSLRFIKGLFHNKLTKTEILLMLDTLKKEKRTDLYLRTCKKAIRIDVYFQRCLFPFPFNIKFNTINNNVDTSFILAIAKQESEFFIHAKSRSGALGLVQVMPNTAKLTAKKIGIKYDKNKLLNDTEYNLLIGSQYLSSLINYYKGSIVLAIAGYNAGPTNVNKWIKLHGDPRDKHINFINWIESIPFKETRNYVQRVIENYVVYQKVMIDMKIKNTKNISELIQHGIQ